MRDVILSVNVEDEVELLAVITKSVAVKTVDGVPEITPVVAWIERPVGRVAEYDVTEPPVFVGERGVMLTFCVKVTGDVYEILGVDA